MLKLYRSFLRLFIRFRYPVSMPEDVAADLGLAISNFVTFPQLIFNLTNSERRPANLVRFMPRKQAEEAFRLALKKECFQQDSLFSYYFNGSWMEFILQFDEESRLRRVYIRHKDLKQKHEILISALETSRQSYQNT